MVVPKKFGLIGVFWTLCSLYTHVNTSSHPDSTPPDATGKRSERVHSHEVDYSNGFPNDFTQGLPSFDFTGPMSSASQHEQSAADAENIGFVHGPPDGFPSLSQLGGDFPSYGNDDSQGPSNRRYQPQSSPSVQHEANIQHGPHSDEQESEGPNPIQSQPEPQRRPLPSHRPLRKPMHAQHNLRPPHPGAPPPHHSHQRPEPGASSSGRHGQYILAPEHEQYYPNPNHPQSHPHPGHNPYHPHPQHHSNPPIVLKVSSKKVRPTKLPPPPPPFYAPSPDLQTASLKNGEAQSHQRQPGFQQRYRREIQTTTKKLEPKIEPVVNGTTASDQIQDGSDDTFWEVSSPYISFDNYEDEKSSTGTEAGSIHRNGSSGDHDAGEQRFFPSFPATNPYLTGLHPFITAPAARPPLFPGPTANRPPSRALQQFGQKYTQVHPQRGPSGVYSAESHDHGDRYVDSNLLGSGNFEVVRGGTFYEDDENFHPGFLGSQHQHSGGGDEGGDYYHHNGHSSPSGFGQQPGSDFFANFRDFADINPHSRAFSHNYETAVNLESAASERKPQNILDKLESRSDDTSRLESKSSDNDPMMATY